MALQLGHISPDAGAMRASSVFIRASSACISLGAAWMRFQFGMRSSALSTSSSIPMGGPFVKLIGVGAVNVAKRAARLVCVRARHE